MRWRGLAWAGVGIAVVAAVGLGVFWKVRGLEEAGWLAGVVGTLAGLTALVITLVDLARRGGTSPAPGPEQQPEPEQDYAAQARAGGAGGTRNTFSGGTAYGPVIMGRDMDLRGPLPSGPSPAPGLPHGPDDGPSGPPPEDRAAADGG